MFLKIYPLLMRLFVLPLMICVSTLSAQVTVFNNDFSTSAGAGYTTIAGPIGNSTVWSASPSGSDWGAGIFNGMLNLTDDASGAANNHGYVLASTSTTAFAAPYQSVLSSNPGMITWTFNMRQPRNNPDGFGASDFGSAFILAGTAGTTNLTGTGYAILLGNTGKTDPIRLVRYNAGIRNFTSLLQSNTSGLTDFGKQYLSIKVTFVPSTNTWSLFVRNDNSAFSDPSTGVLTAQGSVINNTYTSSSLPVMGAYFNGGSFNSQVTNYDNVKVTVAVPEIISIAPSSRIAGTGAFSLMVNGQNFNSGSVVNWNGSPRATTFVSATQVTAAITATDIAFPTTANITVLNGSASSNSVPFIVDPAGQATLTLSTTGLANMVTTVGTASSPLTYTITGANLTANSTVTAPANFELSINNTTWATTLTLTQAQLNGQTVTVYARLRSTAPAGIFSGQILHESAGAANKTVAVTGTVYASEPTLQSSTVTFNTVTSTSITINWTPGNGASRMVIIRSGAAVSSFPVDGTSYTAGSAFGSGSELGTGNFVVYAGSSNSVTVTGLTPATTYHVAVVEYNGSGGTQNYLNTAPAIGNRTTLNAPNGWQIYAMNAVNVINFDTTVDGVNADAFQGDGISSVSATGELNSNAWAVSGFSDGAVGFGQNHADLTDFDRGDSNGNVTTGGIYAFNTSATATENFSLGVQPATGDFAPGTITLRFQNQTGSTINSISIGYKVYVYNDQASSSNFSFSHSANNSTYTAVSTLDVTSPATADALPGWKAYYRVVTITGLTLATNNYYYLRWTGSSVSGVAPFDEFALDDIVMSANPTTNFASFGGTAETFIVQGNTMLSSDLTVSNSLTINAGRVDINGRTLTLNGPVVNTVTGGLRGGATSNLVIGGTTDRSLSFDQTTLGSTNLFNNLSVSTSGANTVTISNPVVVNGTLSVASGQNLNFGTNALTGTLTTISNNGTIQTQNTSALPVPSGKTWGGTGTMNFNAASSVQTVPVGTYNNVTISTTGGAVAAGALTVNGILHLPNNNPSSTTGSLSMGTHTLLMGPNAVNTGVGDVTGIITRTTILSNVAYTYGNPHSSVFFPVAGTLPTSVSVKVEIGTAPSYRPGAIARVYDFIQTGGANTKAVIKASYKDSELNGNNESKLVYWARIISSSTDLEQGRSNYNTTENWIELTNINVGLYFTSTFDQVKVTLDESEAGFLTWNGSVSNSWTTAANWTPNATPSDVTTVIIPDAATTPNDPLLNPAVLLGTLIIEANGILNSPDNAQFTINNGAGAWINNGIYNPGGGTSRVIFTNLDATLAGTTNFNNVTINAGGGLRPLSGATTRIAGSFINNGTLFAGALDNTFEYTGTNQVLAVPNSASLSAYHNLVISGTGAVFPSSLNLRGNLTLNQPVDFSNKTIVMAGDEAQTIGGTAAIAFNNLTISNTNQGVTMVANASVNGTLTLTSGRLNIGNQNLTLGANPVAGSFDSTRMIVTSGTGEVRRNFTGAGSYLFPIGDNTETIEYSPVTVDVTSGTFASAYVGVSVVDAKHPNNNSIDNYLTRYWKVNQSGISNAVATVTGTYLPVDVVGTSAGISSAQLSGTFNQQTNPWTRFSTLSGTTLTASGALLLAGQTSSFTGIKGAAFTVMITGFGEFCQNQPVTLSAQVTGGDAPYTYLWSNSLGTQSSATPSTATVGSTTYTLTITDSNGITATDSATVVVLPPTAGGTLSANQNICAGTLPGNITLSGNTGAVLYWQSSSDAGFSSPSNIANTSTVLTGAAIGQLSATRYFRAVVKNGSCTEAFSSVTTVIIESTTWDGTAWSNGIPSGTKSVIITGNFTASSNIEACSMTVSNNAIVEIPSGLDVVLNGSLSVVSGSFTLQNNANLLQLTNAVNSGNIIVKRNSSALKRQDYTLWSSPVAGQDLFAFSPLTLVSPTSRFYTYNTLTNLYNSIASPSGTLFEAGKGYLIRMPNNHPSVTPTIWTGQFTGVPHNGTIAKTLVDGGAGFRFNLVGNPYPSPISAEAFVVANSSSITGTLYFWRKTNNAESPSYSTWTAGGGFVSNGEAQVFDPNGVIRTGQGFFVEGNGNGPAVTFTNAQRVGDNANQFFRASSELEKNRYWLNVTGANGSFSQMLVGYIEGATLDVDQNIDGRYINDGTLALNSLLNGTDFAIQGRPLPFDQADVVPLSFKATSAGTFVISIDHVDGFFTGSQDIYIKDNLTGSTHDLKAGTYTFASEAGYFDSRFEIVYQTPLSTGNPTGVNVEVLAYSEDGFLNLDAGSQIIKEVTVFDVRGRAIFSKSGIMSGVFSHFIGKASQVLVVKITLDSGAVVNRKVVH